MTSRKPRLFGGSPGAVIFLAAMLAGCGREQVQVYETPKEPPDTIAGAPAGAQAGADGAAVPLRWTLPSGWQEKPASAMRVGSFSFSGKNGQLADVSVIPLGGMPQNELDNVNRWRGMIGLAPITAEDSARQAEKVKIGSAEGHLFDMVSTEAKIDDKYRARILGAMLQRGGTTWFFKMTGDDATVADAKAAFKEFLQSVSFAEAPELKESSSAKRPISTNVRDIPSETVDKPVWKAPANWQEQPASAMLVATFVVTDKNGGQARITISSFPGDVGGPLANVNRWRAQLGLPAVEAADLAGMTSTLDVGGGKAMLVDMTGTDVKTGRKARMVAAMVPREGNTWFYKLMGDESTAAQERDAFVKFVQTVQYPHG
ncbi:MAG: hypothetical protein ACYDH9_24960 [Limisphaerales bacterium]